MGNRKNRSQVDKEAVNAVQLRGMEEGYYDGCFGRVTDFFFDADFLNSQQITVFVYQHCKRICVNSGNMQPASTWQLFEAALLALATAEMPMILKDCQKHRDFYKPNGKFLLL